MYILHDDQHAFLCAYRVKLAKYLFVFGKYLQRKIKYILHSVPFPVSHDFLKNK